MSFIARNNDSFPALPTLHLRTMGEPEAHAYRELAGRAWAKSGLSRPRTLRTSPQCPNLRTLSGSQTIGLILRLYQSAMGFRPDEPTLGEEQKSRRPQYGGTRQAKGLRT
jgi:hypothetical protein